jgi:DNA adenine methylase
MTDYNSDINTDKIKPFLKWVGGKTQILKPIIELIPENINTYIEPFVGGGSVFLEILKNIENNKIKVDKLLIGDLNEDLINLYILIKDNIEFLCVQLDEYISNYKTAKATKHPKNFKIVIDLNDDINDIIDKGQPHVYYYYRKLYNNSIDSFERAALLLFLNKTCFRGLYRTGKNGFNVPFGNYENPQIYIRDDLLILNNLFNKYDITFKSCDYKEICKDITKDDFCYMDPPYTVLKKGSFTSYTKIDFTEDDQKNLLIVCEHLKEKNIKFLQSNSFCTNNEENYKNFTIKKILCKRRINSKNPNDTDYEILIY